MTSDAVSSAAAAAKLSPRKQRQSKPLTDTFFGPRGAASAAKTPSAPASSAMLLSSSPAFATPLHPIRPFVLGTAGAAGGAGTGLGARAGAPKTAILPILLPPATLRPLAFRTFTKKHSLTITSTALQELATFIGRHCGSGWREEGLAERVLEETAKSWKNRNCGFIVDGGSTELKEILKTLEGNMSGGRIVAGGVKAGSGAAAASTTVAAASAARRAAMSNAHINSVTRQNSLLLNSTRDTDITNTQLGLRPTPSHEAAGAGVPLLAREDSQASMGMSGLDVGDDEDDGGADDDGLLDPRRWLKVIGSFDQPRMVYNSTKKHFERETSKPSLLPNTTHKTSLFRNRFNVIHQRLLRNEMFQRSAVAEARAVSALQRSSSSSLHQQPTTHRITPVANLLGRHGTHHMLLGMLVMLPTGNLSICDLSASIVLDLSSAVAIPDDSAWFTPGMIVLVDGVYEEEDEVAGRGLNGATGVGGTIGGRFQAFFIGQPPSETRHATLGISGPDGGADHTIGGGFGWIDFLGVGSHRAVGARMRKLEQRFLLRQQQQHRRQALQLRKQEMMPADVDDDTQAEQPAITEDDLSPLPPGRQRIIILGELNLDQPRTLQALRKVLALYAAEPEGATPVSFVLTGNFTEHAVMARGGSGGSIEYKEYFDALASVLSDYPTLLQSSTFVFVPGDNDGWVSSFAGGAAVPLPRKPVPDLFTSRIRRAFATANAGVVAPATTNGGDSQDSSSKPTRGEAVWTTNPSRLSLFGPNHEIVLFRDDISSRLRRTAVRLRKSQDADGAEEAGAASAAEGATADATSALDSMDIDGEAATVTAATAAVAAAVETDKIPHNIHTARKLVKTLLDQGYLAPFKQSHRPVHWDFASALHLYPLPTAMVLVDTTAPPFCVTYEGCHVMNPGCLLVTGRRSTARWIEYEIGRIGKARECTF